MFFVFLLDGSDSQIVFVVEKGIICTQLYFVMFFSLKENLVDTRDAIHGRENTANILERHFSLLESTFVNMQWRLAKLARQ